MDARSPRFLILLLVVCVVLVAGGYLLVAQPRLPGFFSSTENLRSFVESTGFVAPLVIILYQVLQVVVAPIPGQGLDFANGFLFGPVFGSFISLAGISAGTILAMFLARKFGRPLVRALVSERGLAAVERYLDERSLGVFFLLFLIPSTPDDLLCFAYGLTPLPLKRGFIVALLGRAPGVVASVLVGSAGGVISPVAFLFVSVLVSIIMILMLSFWPRRQELAFQPAQKLAHAVTTPVTKRLRRYTAKTHALKKRQPSTRINSKRRR